MTAGKLGVEITWRPLTEQDYFVLRRWLSEPHVARWWNHDTSLDAVRRDFGPAVRGEEATDVLLALYDGQPVGLLQRSRLAAYPEYHRQLAELTTVPDGTFSVDYLVGDPDRVGHGIGTAMIRSAVERTWADHPDASCVVVPVVAANVASWRALEKAGFVRVATGELEPDNPVDDPLHYVYRLDRPAPTKSLA